MMTTKEMPHSLAQRMAGLACPYHDPPEGRETYGGHQWVASNIGNYVGYFHQPKLIVKVRNQPARNLKASLLRVSISDRASQIILSNGMQQEFTAAVAMTRNIFGARISVDAYDDAEIAGLTSLSVHVSAHGNIQDIAAADAEWHSRIIDVAPQSAELFCLSIDDLP